jgi:hypothetical protein
VLVAQADKAAAVPRRKDRGKTGIVDTGRDVGAVYFRAERGREWSCGDRQLNLPLDLPLF